MTTQSASETAPTSSVASGWAVKSPRGETTRTPRRRSASSCASAGDENDLGAAPGEGRSDVGPDRSGAEDAEAHVAYFP